jgi:hypothetical protein
LDDLVKRYFKFQISKAEQKGFDLKTPLTQEQIIYAALDIRMPWGVKAMQVPRINKAQIGWTLQIENDAVPAFGDKRINGLWVNPEKWQLIIDENKAALANALDVLDTHFIPLVGVKELPDPERVAVAHAAFKACDIPTVEENEVTLQIKQAKKAKNPALVVELDIQRALLQEDRAKRKADAKAYHKSISYLDTKKFADEVAKMKGQAKINYASADQVRAALIAGPYGLDDQSLPDLDAKTTLINHLDLPVIVDYVTVKQIEKQLSTYGYRWITTRDKVAKDSKNKKGFVDPDTGRIHPPFRQLGTETGRPSCSNPNVLNMDKEEKFRDAFEARDGHMNITKDCAGQELRILTEISREPSWIEAFNADKDVHSISAHMIRRVLWESGTVHKETLMLVKGKDGNMVEKLIPPCAYFYNNFKKCKCPKHEEIRTKFKAVNFGIAYDKQKYSLAIELGITQDEAQDILDGWKETFSITQAALVKLRDTSYERGEARTLSNRRRILSKVTYDQAEKKADEKYGKGKYKRFHLEHMMESLIAAVKREGGNMPIQGTGADMMKLAMGCGFDPNGNPYLWHLLEPLYGALLEIYVYDEFMVETPEEHCETVGGPEGVGGVISDAIIRAGAQFVTVVPMASEGAIAKTWTK